MVVRLLRYLGPYKRLVALSILTMLVYSAAGVATPWVVHLGIDARLRPKGWFVAVGAGLALALLAVLQALANYAHLNLLARASQRVLYTLRTQMFAHLQRLSLAFIHRHETGRLMSRVQNDVTELQEFLSVLVLGLGDLVSLLGITGAMLAMEWRLGLLVLMSAPLAGLVLWAWQGRAQRAFLRVRRALAFVNANLQENIAGVRVVQALRRERANMEHFDRLNAEHLDANLHASRLAAALLPVVEGLTGLSTALVVGIGGWMTLRGELSVGALVAFVLYSQRFFDPIRNLTMQYTQLQRAMASGYRIFEVLDAQPEVVDPPDAPALPPLRGEVHLEGVRFAYQPGVEVLHGIDLHIRPGEVVALVGSTGAGKSTLVSLLLRLYDPTQGRILVDGYDIRRVRRDSLLSQMAFVPQEPFLFSASVRENIRYHRTYLTDAQVEEAARAVGAHDFILSLPRGYDTVLQERGQDLSVGQRQLIALARALVGDPRILILDEATASVDSATEARIQQALERLLQGRTAIVIAHRLSTVRRAHRIVVLESGRIVEEGTLEALLARGGLFARLYRSYFLGEAVPSPAG
ncbi:putative ABC transporter ATP-binding protein [bacterium HR23]|nr:putative ABC transporter ATP-binding protein [bacterium HR23]